jgi:DNA-binding transcriptional ArsR family regulator
MACLLRINFSTEDIARTRIAAGPDPLWELVLSIQMLRGQPGDLLFTQWRRTAATALREPSRWQVLMDLVPQIGYFPDFLNPVEARRGFEHGLEAVRATPRQVLTRDLRRLAPPARPGQDWKALAAGDPDELHRLTDLMRAYYSATVEPVQATLDAAVEHDRQVRLRAFANGGLDGVLASLRPMASWSYGELRVPAHRDQVINLDGRGLVLLPTFFCLHHPMTLFDESLPPVLVNPIARAVEALPAPRGPRPGLTKLIGATRTAVLDAASTVSTTSEIARRVGISLPSASEHTTVLRAAGLVTSYRDGQRMRHVLTKLGHDLLNGRSSEVSPVSTPGATDGAAPR